MKPAKQGLQKFTKSDKKIQELLSKKRISEADLGGFNSNERNELGKQLTELLNTKKDIERDELLYQIDEIIPKDTKKQIWESNHIKITYAISTLMQEYGRMPTGAELAIKTDLSRQTIHKHLKEFANHPQYLEQMEQFRFMSSKVLARVFQFAVNGDTGAAKLYFNVMGNLSNSLPSGNTLIQNQNNYIQINGIVLSQERIGNLKPEQLNAIEAILIRGMQEDPSITPQKEIQ